jgi:signal recognition particle subunit SEC65
LIATLEVEEVAEARVIDALRKLGFTIVQPGARNTGAKVIEAWKARQRVVVHVNTTVSPAAPCSLTLEEEQALRRRATKTGGHAWEVRVLLGSDLELVQLEWRALE